MDQTTRPRTTRPRTLTNGASFRRRAVATAATALALAGPSMVVVGANATAAGATAKATKSVIVSTATIANVGKVLQSGKTLYTLKETKPCTSACLKIWPALLLPKGDKKAKAGPGVIASKLGSVAVSGGLRQVTYGGKALYLFVGDTSAATVNGNVSDEWGTWAPVVTKKASTSSAGSGGTAASTGGSAF